ncbi:MarR family winged helix-turn-helix transcriptional regulator [Streptomyces olivoreticuli]
MDPERRPLGGQRVDARHGDEPVAASELGAKTLLSRSQVSRVVDSLSGRGLAERVPSPTDARSVRIALTEAGRRAFAEADATRRAALAEPFDDRLDDEDIEALERVWAKLKAACPRGPRHRRSRRFGLTGLMPYCSP